MIQNYFNIAWRNLVKNKLYSLINVGGLALGMLVAMLTGLWVFDELSYNWNHTNYEHIAQVYRRNTERLEQKTYSSEGVPQPVAKVLKENYGHLFKQIVLVWWETPYNIQIGDRGFVKTGQFIDSGLIDMLSLKMLRGGTESLNDYRAIILSQSTARALFGDHDAVGQSIQLDGKMEFTVTGVYADLARNSTFGHIQFFGNFEGLKAFNAGVKANENNWENTACRIFVHTADGVTVEQASAAIADLYLKDTPEQVAQYSKKYKTTAWLHPMKDWYLYSDFVNGNPAGGRITFVWLFAIVGMFVLLLACINFINLSTARSEKRAKEVGIRKAVGSLRSQLINQFLSESVLSVSLAMIIAVLLVTLSLGTFNSFADKNISLPLTNIYFWIACIVCLLLTSCLAGLYPAFYLSSFQPVKVLKGTLRVGRYAALPRKILVVIQVTVSVVLIIGTIVVYQQIQYGQNRPVGYENEGLIRIPMNDTDLDNSKWVMRNELMASGVAGSVGFSSSPVTAIYDNWGGFTWKGKNPEAESNFTVTWVNEEYGKTIRWKVLQGRDFSTEYRTDENAVIINKSAAEYMGLQNPLGEFVTLRDGNQQRQIIGVVDDVIAVSPYEQVSPAFYWLAKKNPEYLEQMLVKLDPGISVADALTKIESIQRKLSPSSPFAYSFVDEEYGRKFTAEQRVGKLALFSTVLAMLISCLGLFGLSSFMAERKTKEIGIRKVVGASVFSIWRLLSKEFVIVVVVSCLIAMPVAYYFLHQWLANYYYHTDLNPLVFVYAAVGALAITLCTVSYQTIKASVTNPVRSLRNE
jgi:putative ABC transport system permease protein